MTSQLALQINGLLYPFITARKRSLLEGYVFTRVCHSVHRGVWPIACWDAPLLHAGMPPLEPEADRPLYPWTRPLWPPGTRGRPPRDQRQTPSPRDQRQAPPRDQRQTPPGALRAGKHTGNWRAVRILLECILVATTFTQRENAVAASRVDQAFTW